jgi:diguanylate cyclase (GGDEF)-like protein/PAS domain S-box-containing protein
MHTKHSLLKRQLKKYLGDSFALTEKWQTFVDAVNDAYVQSDIDREMLERSLDLSSQELLQANAGMKSLISLLNATIESTADGILVVDREGKIVSFNTKFIEMWHIPGSILKPMDDEKALAYVVDQLINPDSFIKKVKELYAEPDANSYDILEFKDGRVFERYSQPQKIGTESIGRVWSFRDVTERKQTENALRDSEEKYRSLVESTDDSIYLVDRDYKYVFINKQHLIRLGLSEGKYLGRPYSEFHSPKETQLFIEKADQVFTNGNSIQHEYQSDRDERYFLLTLSPVKEKDGTITAITVISKEITYHKMMEKKLRTLTVTDQLTGVYNRRGFLNLSEHQLRLAKRNKIGLYLLYLDLNNPKVINDQYGHKEGDNALTQIAQMLRNTYRESDVIARIGGDEFAIILHEGNSAESRDRIIARLEQALKEQNSKMVNQYELSASIGVAYYDPQRPQTLDKLLADADSMMYKQKRSKSQT